jgi:Flp pilus assembly protein TadD
MNDTIKLLDIIGKLWPLVITIFLIVVIIIKWRTIWKAVGSFSVRQVRLKAPGAEIELFATKDEKAQPEISDSQTSLTIIEPKDEEANHSIYDAYELLIQGKIKEAERMYEDIQRETSDDKRVENSLYFNYYKFMNGVPSALDSIVKILGEERLTDHDKYLGYFYLAYCFKTAKQKNKAIEKFNIANKYAKNEEEKIPIIINIAQTYSDDYYVSEAIAILKSNFYEFVEKDSKIKLLKELAVQYKKNENIIMQICCLELASELAVNDTSILFDLAYAYSTAKFEEASIFQYSNLLYFNADQPGALNNIGVGYKQKGLSISAVEFYKKSIEKDNSLAAGNLAKIYIEAGFETEAAALIEKFKMMKDVDQMLISAQETLLSSVKKENEQKKQIKDVGYKYSNFFKNYAVFSISKKPVNFVEKNWCDENNTPVSVTLKDDDLVIEWRTKNEVLNDEDYFQIYGKINQGCQISFDYPTTVSTGLLTRLYSSDPIIKDKPYRKIIKYSGYCSLNLNDGLIQVLYHVDKEVIIKEIKKVPSE